MSYNIVLEYLTHDKNPESIKNLWKRDIAEIHKNLEWISKDLNVYNHGLENEIKIMLENRKKEAEANKTLIDSIMK